MLPFYLSNMAIRGSIAYHKSMKKIIVILGPTASGKSDLAIDLAIWLGSKTASNKLKITGAEIVSADSRQIYKGMDIGTGKVTKKEMRGIPHHLLDITSPKQKFDVVRYKQLAEKAIEKISSENKIPIICGGTGFYIQAIVDNVIFPKVKPDEALRKKLEKEPLKKLLATLKKLDPIRFKNIDHENKRRIIRAIEIAKTLGKVPQIKSAPKYQSLQIGITKSKEDLQKLIEKRLIKRLKQGMIREVKKLRANGVSWKKLLGFGLEYRYIALYLQGKISKEEMIKQLDISINQYAKRQITWFKRDPRITWLSEKNTPTKNKKEAENLLKKFLAS